jgi:hypothetical protein
MNSKLRKYLLEDIFKPMGKAELGTLEQKKRESAQKLLQKFGIPVDQDLVNLIYKTDMSDVDTEGEFYSNIDYEGPKIFKRFSRVYTTTADPANQEVLDGNEFSDWQSNKSQVYAKDTKGYKGELVKVFATARSGYELVLRKFGFKPSSVDEFGKALGTVILSDLGLPANDKMMEFAYGAGDKSDFLDNMENKGIIISWYPGNPTVKWIKENQGAEFYKIKHGEGARWLASNNMPAEIVEKLKLEKFTFSKSIGTDITSIRAKSGRTINPKDAIGVPPKGRTCSECSKLIVKGEPHLSKWNNAGSVNICRDCVDKINTYLKTLPATVDVGKWNEEDTDQ